MPKTFGKKISFAIVCSFLFVAAVIFSTFELGLRPQAQTLEPKTLVESASDKTLPVKSSGGTVEKTATNSIFAQAAAQNSDLRTNFSWTFGGKAQRGWYLYEPLLNQLLKVESADGNDFAAALSRWQQAAGLQPNGILDETALFAIIKTWQSNRLKASGYPLSNELLTAPVADFWDESRAADLRQVERETYTAYKKMVAAAIADKSLNLKTNFEEGLAASERFLKIVSAFRSREYQEKLRAASPNSGRAGLAVNSPHFTGRALDIYVGGEPVSTADENRLIQVKTPVYRWLVKNAAKFGFKPYFYEPWHWEYAPNE